MIKVIGGCLVLAGLVACNGDRPISFPYAEAAEGFTCRLSGKVVKVADGDTVTVLGSGKQQYRIRLAGIDAPEKKQAFGQASKDALAGLVAGKLVCVDWKKRDQYQRYLGMIRVNGNPVNIRLLELGLAWHYKQFANEQSPSARKAFADAEAKASAAKVGLWQERNPVAPWDFRKQQKGD